jgi:hypothetical protein
MGEARTTTAGFDLNAIVPRRSAIAAIEAWSKLVSRGNRFFLLEGPPGSGKTIISLGLAPRSSHETVNSAPQIDAAHFCQANRGGSINPNAFVEAISGQLCRIKAFADALVSGERRQGIQIQVHQNVGNAETVTGVYIDKVVLQDVSAEDGFLYALANPLRTAAIAEPNRPWFILVDALDEATAYGGNTNIVDLLAQVDDLPETVRFLVTSRPDDNIRRYLSGSGLSSYRLDLDYPDKKREAELRALISILLSQKPSLGERLAPSLNISDLVEKVIEKAAGNFLYVVSVIGMLETTDSPINSDVLASLPEGLSGFYQTSFGRMFNDTEPWQHLYMPILGAMSVAREPLTEQQLVRITTRQTSEVRRALVRLRRFLSADDDVVADRRRWGVFHRSLADFLLDGNSAGAFWCPALEQHTRIVAATKVGYSRWTEVDWPRIDDYLLRYLFHHLAQTSEDLESIEECLSGTFMNETAQRFGAPWILENLRIAMAEARRNDDLQRLLRFGWIYVSSRDQLAQKVAPPIMPAYVKLGMTDRALEYGRELDSAGRFTQSEVLEGLSNVALTLIDVGEIDRALEVVALVQNSADRDTLQTRCALRMVRQDPSRALEILGARSLPGEDRVQFCAALAQYDQYVDAAITLADEADEALQAIALELFERDTLRAESIIGRLGTWTEDVGGVRFTREPTSVFKKRAIQIANKNPLAALALTTRIRHERELYSALIVIAGPLAAAALDRELRQCIARLTEDPSLSMLVCLAGANSLLYGASLHKLPEIGIALQQLEKFGGFFETRVDVAIDAASNLDLPAMAAHPHAGPISHTVVRRIVSTLDERDDFERKWQAARFLGRWIALCNVTEGLSFVDQIEKIWRSYSPGNDAAAGVVEAVSMSGIDALLPILDRLRNSQRNPDICYRAALKVLADRNIEEAFRLIDSVSMRYNLTRSSLLGILAVRLPANRPAELRKIIDRMPNYVDTAEFSDTYRAV